MARSDFEIGSLDRGYKLVALEREVTSGPINNYLAIQLMVTQQRSSYYMFKT